MITTAEQENMTHFYWSLTNGRLQASRFNLLVRPILAWKTHALIFAIPPIETWSGSQ